MKQLLHIAIGRFQRGFIGCLALLLVPFSGWSQVPGNFQDVCPPFESESVCGQSPGAGSGFTLEPSIPASKLPDPKASASTVEIKVQARGDLNDGPGGGNDEGITYFDEDGNQLGSAQGGNCSDFDCQYPETQVTVSVPVQRFNNWISDGDLTITAEVGDDVDADYFTCQGTFGTSSNSDNDAEVKFSVDYPISYQPGATFSISGKDTIFVNTQGTYRLNVNPQSLSAQYARNWYINGTLFQIGGDKFSYAFQDADTLSVVAAGCNGSLDTVEKVIYTKTPTRCPKVEFFSSENRVTTLSQIQLNDLSKIGPTGWQWKVTDPNNTRATPGFDYGPQSDPTSQNPKGTFIFEGTYDVCLTAFNAACPAGKQLCKDDYITVLKAEQMCTDVSSTDSLGILADNGGANDDYDEVVGQPCSYTISPCATSVDLDLTQLDLKNNQAFLRIYDGTSANGDPLWNTNKFGNRGITGNLSQSALKKKYKAKSGNVYVEFETGSNPEGKGFKLRWEAINEGLDSLSSNIQGDSLNCVGFPVTFNANANFGNVSYEWYVDSAFSDQPEGTNSSYTYDSVVSGQTTVGLVVENCGRYDTSEKVISGFQPTKPPEVDFEVSQTFGRVGAVISISDISEPCIESREWTISPNSFDFVRGNDSSSNAALRFNAPGSYTISLVDSNRGGVADTTKFGVIQIQEYCEPTVDELKFDLGMNRVTLANMDNASSVGTDEYTNFNGRAVKPKLEQGADYTIGVERDNSFNTVKYKAWIDFNANGKFEANEVFAQSGPVTGNSWDQTVTIDENRSIGTYQMRVAANFGRLSNDPCNNDFGEYEDYLIEIIPDTTSPEIQLIGKDPLTIPACSDPRILDQFATVTDNADGPIQNANVTENVDSASPGDYTVTYSYTDTAGNRTAKERTVTVAPDSTAPSFQLKGSRFIRLSVDDNFTDPGTTNPVDDCTGIDQFNKQSGVDPNKLGVDTIVYTATDNSGNKLQRERYVEFFDTTSPTFRLSGANPLVIALSDSYNDPGVLNLSDNFWAENDIDVTVESNVNDAAVGEYEVRYTATDGSGNTSKRTRIVRVEDQTPPKITKVKDTFRLPVFTELDVSSVVNVVDNNSPVTQVSTGGSFIQQFPDMEGDVVGTYDLSVTYEDRANNRSSASVVVKVVDNEAPEISLKGPAYLTFDRWSTTPYESPDSVNVNDNYYEDFQISVDTSGTYFTAYKQDSFPGGVFEITYQAEDLSGNRSDKVTRVVEAVAPATGVEKAESNTNFSVYPNPANERTTVAIDFAKTQDYRLELVNALGETVEQIASGKGQTGEHVIMLNGYAKGTYFIRVITESGVQSQEIVVQ